MKKRNPLLEYIRALLLEFDWEQFSAPSQQDDDPVMRSLGALQADPEGQKAVVAHKQQQEQGQTNILTANAQLLAQKGIVVNKLQKLGAGAGGTAYSIDNQRVLKVTGDASEAQSSNAVKGKNLAGIINISDVWKFPNSNLYGIVMEKIIPFRQWPNDKIKENLEEIVDTFNLKSLLQKYHGDWDKIWGEINSSPLNMPNTDKKGLQQALVMLRNIASSLESAGIHNFFDLHLDNLGKRQNGQVVLFDIGFVKGGAEPPILGSH